MAPLEHLCWQYGTKSQPSRVDKDLADEWKFARWVAIETLAAVVDALIIYCAFIGVYNLKLRRAKKFLIVWLFAARLP